MAAGALAGCGTGTQDAGSGSAGTEAKKITGVADLAGAKIAVQEGTTGDDYVTEEVEGAEISRFKRIVDAGMDLRNGRVDAVVVDDQVAKAMEANRAQVYNAVGECPAWARTAVAWAVESGYIRGDEAGRLGLDSTRLWALQVMYNAAQGGRR